MKEDVLVIENEDLRIILTRQTIECFRSMPREFIREPWYLNPEPTMPVLFWGMIGMFGSPSAYRDEDEWPYSFPFRLDIRKGKVTAVYAALISLYHAKFDMRIYRCLAQGKGDGYVHEPTDEFNHRDMVFLRNYLMGMCKGFVKAAPKPEFYRAMRWDDASAVFGCQRGEYFYEEFVPSHYEEEAEASVKAKPDEGTKTDQAIWELCHRLAHQAFERRMAELKELMGPEFDERCEIPADKTLDYQGYSTRELGLVRRGEARCLLRLLHLRFGQEAEHYAILLEKADSFKLACYSESILTAKKLDEVFILPNSAP